MSAPNGALTIGPGHRPVTRHGGGETRTGGQAAPETPTDQPPAGALRRLWPYLARHRAALMASLGAIALFTLLSVVPPLLLRALIDRVIVPGAWSLLPWIGAAIIVVPLLAAGVRFLGIFNLMRSSRRFIAELRQMLYRKILNLDLRYHSENASGSLVGRMMDDVTMVQTLITQNTLQILVDAVVFVVAIVMAFTIAWQLALPVCLILFAYWLLYRRYSNRIQDHTTAYRETFDEINGRMQETVAGVRQVRIFNQELRESMLFNERSRRSLDSAFGANLGMIAIQTGGAGIQQLGGTLIFGFGAWLVLSGALTYGDLLAFGMYMGLGFQPVVRLTNVAGSLEETFVSLHRICDTLDEPERIADHDNAIELRPGPGRVELRDVDFAYEEDQPLYEGLNLVIPAGATVALVGHTGCGKTTLTQLILRNYDVQRGRVLIDGVDVRHVTLGSLRSRFGVVLQKSAVFDGTVADNIAWARPDASREEIVAAAEAAELHELILAYSDGYDTLLGEHGVALSVGEKQRLSIARAILRDPSILILDEATSALDSASEAAIQRALERVLADRTSIVVAHRLSTIVSADLIVVMDAGAIVEQGTHDELMAIPNGRYRQLYRELQGEEREGAA